MYSFYWMIFNFLILGTVIKLGINEHFYQTVVMNNDQKREERATKAQEILKFMNGKIDPCKDFYSFVCGNWLQYQQISLLKPNQLFSVRDQMLLKIKQQLQVMLEEPMASSDSRNTRNMKDFYRACKTADNSSPLQRKFVREFVHKNGGLPYISGSGWQDTYNWLQVIATLRHSLSLNILISFDIIKDTTRRSNNAAYNILLSEPKTTVLPVDLCNYIAVRQQYNTKQQQYELIQDEVKENMKAWFEMRELEALRLAGDIVRFEFELCKHMGRNDLIKANAHENERKAELSEYLKYNYMNGVPQFPAQTPHNLLQFNHNYQLDLKTYVDLCLGNSIRAQVFLHNSIYFQHLAEMSRTWSMHSFATYIMYTALAAINFPLHETLKQRNIHCIEKILHYLPNIIGDLYDYNYNYKLKFIDNDMKHDIEVMGKMIKKLLQKTIELSSTLRQDIKPYILGRLHPIRFSLEIHQDHQDHFAPKAETMIHDIQYMDYWHKLESIMMYRANQSLIPIDSVIQPYDVNAKFDPSTNRIIIGLGLLQAPFYSKNYPQSLKYAFLGYQLTRELIRAIDIQNIENFYNNRFDCFRSQYSNYLYNHPNNFHDASQLIDIVADSGALNIAFDLYLNWLETVDSRDFDTLSSETLTNVNFSNTQLFFIYFTQTRCIERYAIIKPKLNISPTDEHTKEHYEVNGPLINNIEFAREFNCEFGTEMNPYDKCFVY